MAFPLINYASSELQRSSLNDMINNALSGYTNMTNARYLRPNLEEQLRKSQLFNQYYAPDMESQIGLRGAQTGLLGKQTQYYGPDIESQIALRNAQAKQSGAQTGLLGEQTNYAHMQNQALPAQLKRQAEADQLKSIQEKVFNQMLQQRLSGGPSQQDFPNPTYSPGQGGAPFALGGQPENNLVQIPQQQPTADDLFNKKVFNLDTFTPRYKAQIDEISKTLGKKEAAQLRVSTEQSLKDISEINQYKSDLPKLDNNIERLEKLKKIIQQHPEFSGHNLGFGPFKFEKTSKNPLVGYVQASLLPDIISNDQALRTSGSNLAINIGKDKVPSFDKSQAINLGNVDALLEEAYSKRRLAIERIGGYIIRRGSDDFKKLPNGKWVKIIKKGS